MDLIPGQTFNDYEVLAELGRGGMGKVYKVRSIISQRIEAMKLLLPDLTADPELTERFLREIRISAGLDHPHIAALRTAQRVGGQLAMIMEFVEGPTLRELMLQSRIPIEQSLRYISQALEALIYAHGQGVIHRDIKPGNMMVPPSGQLKLMDFGVAKLATDTQLTKTGVMVGSVHYMSPEQIEGHEVDARSDIYSLGVTLYEMVTGRRPFEGDSEYKIMAAHLKGSPQPPIEIDPSVPAVVNEIILAALAKDPATRFGSARAMHAAVQTVLSKPANTTVALPPRIPASAQKSHRTFYILAGSLTTLAVLAVGIWQLPNFRHAHAAAATPQTASISREQPTKPVDTAPPPTQTTPSATPIPDRQPQPAIKLSEKPSLARPVAQPRTRPEQVASTAPVSSNPYVKADAPPPAAVTPPIHADDPELPTLQDRMVQMNARVTAVKASLDRLEHDQAASGLGLRSDIVAAEERLLAYMSQASTSLQNQDARSTRKRLDQAETDLEKLESFLGR